MPLGTALFKATRHIFWTKFVTMDAKELFARRGVLPAQQVCFGFLVTDVPPSWPPCAPPPPPPCLMSCQAPPAVCSCSFGPINRMMPGSPSKTESMPEFDRNDLGHINLSFFYKVARFHGFALWDELIKRTV